MELLIALCLGVTLSAACGFRIFIPPLIMSGAALYGDLELASEFAWMESPVALITFAIATGVEILAYYLPGVDNLLDTIEIPTAIAIGTAISASALGEVDPVLQWTIAAIAGGGVAGTVEGFTSVTRLASTGMTGGFGNPIVSTIEALSAVVLTFLALFVPVLAAVVVTFILVLAIRKLIRFFTKNNKQ
ncbi:DUF4126 domain-containing protein [Spirulina sp. CS-785/01]|uniref:DUF4126 domain-containing protein n=1 Tax=Spirulina sp. CS-785/01 TaxID=3021716 RepID=UPI00232DD2F5|nr:DUF4126 domain-containing protein [Spirulina sp. CS-785/01]MDB9311566.1 DUF4126 domain-containing protein [Spirulina sp. CS-785/01]